MEDILPAGYDPGGDNGFVRDWTGGFGGGICCLDLGNRREETARDRRTDEKKILRGQNYGKLTETGMAIVYCRHDVFGRMQGP